MRNFLGRKPRCSPSDWTNMLQLPVMSSTSIECTLHHRRSGKNGTPDQTANSCSQFSIVSITYHSFIQEDMTYLIEETFFTDKWVPLYSLCSLRIKSYHLKSWRITTCERMYTKTSNVPCKSSIKESRKNFERERERKKEEKNTYSPQNFH